MAGKSADGEELPVKAFGWAAIDSSGILSPFKFSRRATGEHDVQLKVLYCGICYYDTKMIKNKRGVTRYPFVFGHEIVGEVTEVGSEVRKFKPGEKVGVGCMVGSCRTCESCANNCENYCPNVTVTDGAFFFKTGTVLYGGCSNIMVVDEHFAIRWPENFPLDAGAPLLCAGITTYSPLRNFGLDKPGMHVGVFGLGGLGHVAVKFAKAFGAKVTVISASPSKKKEAIEKHGADSFLDSNNSEEMQAAMGTMHGIIDTVPANHSLVPLLDLLKPQGKVIVVGGPEKPFELPVFPLLQGGRTVAGSATGGIQQTQEMIDFAAKHNILPDVEVIPIDYVNTAIERILKGDVKYRFVIDIGKTLQSA